MRTDKSPVSKTYSNIETGQWIMSRNSITSIVVSCLCESGGSNAGFSLNTALSLLKYNVIISYLER